MPPGWADNYLAGMRGLHGVFDGRAARGVGRVPAGRRAAVAHIGLVFVHPSRWREGIAGAMLERAEAEMVARGYCASSSGRRSARRPSLLPRAGWDRDGRREWHPWVGLEMVGYARDLP